MTQALQYVLPTAVQYPKAHRKVRKIDRKTLPRTITPEDMELVTALEAAKSDMAFIHNRFDQTTDETLIDALAFELKAAGLRYKYYHNQIKAKGIVSGG